MPKELTDKQRVKNLSAALKWEAYAKTAPKWMGRKGGIKRAQKRQKQAVQGYITKALRKKD